LRLPNRPDFAGKKIRDFLYVVIGSRKSYVALRTFAGTNPLISERVTAGMKAAAARGRHLGRPPIPRHVVAEIKALAASTDLSVRKIHQKMAGKARRGVVGEITKQVRSP